ncbi:hypothetical protein M422DRAFT_275508 [Sphaerobolus stellatus SS14]|uniref:Uncharacterized protein n=1 Tax=Sphaerobolus stellatus (strain SS14) TaxID=990650 RepID=A0A0C9U3Y9_SPHS4|nr:hypothetical protein M422DRAFT_275508 [Sphaerobolus stellatus SS14]
MEDETGRKGDEAELNAKQQQAPHNLHPASSSTSSHLFILLSLYLPFPVRASNANAQTVHKRIPCAVYAGRQYPLQARRSTTPIISESHLFAHRTTLGRYLHSSLMMTPFSSSLYPDIHLQFFRLHYCDGPTWYSTSANDLNNMGRSFSSRIIRPIK